MAESVLSFVLERLGDLLIEEAKFIHGVGGQAQEIYRELRWMQAFLRDADAKENEEQRIREWVADVRTLAYDAGDVLESFLLRVESKRKGGIRDILKRYLCILNESVVLHETGSEIQEIKERISGLRSRLDTYGIKSLSEAQGNSNFAGERRNQLRRTYSHVIEDEEVASHVGPEGFLHRPRILNEDESWKLLKKKAFNKRDHTDHEELKEKLGIEMVRRCGGLPLAIIVLGGILVTKHSLREWENVSQNIKSFLRKGEGVGQHNGGVEDILALSYNDLPYQLKPCFLYLGKFKEDSEIEVESLYQLWMAESMVLLEDRKDRETMMDVAECYLGELAQRCMVQVQLEEEGCGITKFNSCRLHDMLRELCLSKAKEEDFFYTIDFKHENNSEHVGSSTSFTSKPRRLVIYSHEENNSSEDVSVNTITSQHLRSLLLFNESLNHEECMPRMVESCLNDFKLLRVLAIEGLNPFELPKATGSLIHLRYLSLRNTYFVMFPSSIENLKHLQSLDLRGRKSVSFQCKGNVLGKMRQLRHLYLPKEMARSFQASKLQLDGLINLEILENFDPSWCRSEDLIKLINLRKLTATVKLQNLKGAEDIISYLSPNFRRIRYSFLRFEDCNFASEEWQTILIRYACVHELVIKGSLGNKLPGYNNISTIPSRLTKLHLSYSKLVEDPMPILEALPNLRSLWLCDAFKGEEMVCSSNGFLQLRSLRLLDLVNFQSWRVEDGAMPKLSVLIIDGCISLRMIPDGMRFITTLQELKVMFMHEEFSKRVQAVVDGEKGEDFDKIGHVASISVH